MALPRNVLARGHEIEDEEESFTDLPNEICRAGCNELKDATEGVLRPITAALSLLVGYS